MNYNFINLIGQRFGKLQVIARLENDAYGNSQWLCECDCGNKIKVHKSNLNSRQTTKSCGCLKKERLTSHGQCGTNLYNVWCGMKRRCYNVNDKNYHNYGGRGIRVCNDWLTFEGFHLWAIEQEINENCCDKDGNKLTIERKNVDGHYEPDNCCWIPFENQGSNKRNTVRINDNGIDKSLRQYCKEHNLQYNTIRTRINRSKWSIDKAIRTPIIKR